MLGSGLAAGLLMGTVGGAVAVPVPDAVTVDRPMPKERPGPGERVDPRCNAAQNQVTVAENNVMRARQAVKAAPKKKKKARKAVLRRAKQAQAIAEARVERYC
jgi:hypothetical protein